MRGPRIVQLHAHVAIEAAEDLGSRLALPGQVRPSFELTGQHRCGKVGTRRMDPALYAHAAPAQIGSPQRLVAAPVEPQIAGDPALRGARVDVAQRQHATAQLEMSVQRRHRFELAVAHVDMGDVDEHVGVHRPQR